MFPDWQIPRHCLVWLLLAYFGAIVPHFSHLPPWLTAVVVAALLWRIQIYRGVWRYPKPKEKILLLLVFAAGLLLQYGTLGGLDPMVALLISAYTMKLLEMHQKRDCYVLIFIGYFVAAIACLYFQSIAVTLYVMLSLLPVSAALVALHQSGDTHLVVPLKKASRLLAQSLPLMVALFLIMPRLGSLWSVPQQNQAITGVSSTMSPGDFTSLGRSAKTAFRVEFNGDIPAQRELYWRGLVLTQFDGRTWRLDHWQPWQLTGQRRQPWDRLIERRGEALKYQVTLEPTHARWLFALSTPLPLNDDIGLTRDFNLRSVRKISSKRQYTVNSWLQHRLEPELLNLDVRQASLQLPEGSNPRTREIARQWRAESVSEQALIDRLLQLFSRDFHYTLKPPALGEHSVDEFLWQTRRGFCEHFAGSFVFFMRAAGIPARVVAGYQGGEIHPEQGYLTVRQYDAHAWAEVWFPEQGWVRVDPTFAVAPERIDVSIFEALGQEEGLLSDSPLALVRYRDINWLNSLRLRLESLDYAWAKWVLGYEQVQQQTLLKLLGRIDPWRIGAFLLMGAVLGLLPWMIGLLRSRRAASYDELDRLYLRFCRRLATAGLPRKTGEAPGSYAARAVATFPGAARQVEQLTRYYEAGRYRGDKNSIGRMKQLLSEELKL